eukprot:scaffold56631_cov33-Tisochrysis_lutea.AAC.4
MAKGTHIQIPCHSRSSFHTWPSRAEVLNNIASQEPTPAHKLLALLHMMRRHWMVGGVAKILVEEARKGIARCDHLRRRHLCGAWGKYRPQQLARGVGFASTAAPERRTPRVSREMWAFPPP